MPVHKTAIPFNKDMAPVGMLKQAAEDLEHLFNCIEQTEHYGMSNKEADQMLAGAVRDIYAYWKQKYPAKSA
jgi:hypothetical protein